MKYKDKVKLIRNQKRELKAGKRRKLWLNFKRKGLEGKSARQRKYLDAQRYAVRIEAPIEFSIKQQPDKVFEFIATLKKFKKTKSLFKFCSIIIL